MMQRDLAASPRALLRSLERVFHRVTRSAQFLQTLDTDTLLRRGLGEVRGNELIAGERARRESHGQALEAFLSSAEAHAGILGERYDDSVQAGAIHGVLSEARKIDLDQRELLHPAPTRVPEPYRRQPGEDIHSMKTPLSPL